jgi:hypothetical protein
MLSFARLQHSSEALFKALTGLIRKEFQELLWTFTKALDQYDRQQAERPNRQRAVGAGGSASLDNAREKLLFILTYVKQYPTQDLQGILFGKTQPWACKWVHRLMPLLEQALGAQQHLPLRRTTSVEELQSRCPELQFIIDGTERPVARPVKEPAQREQYSGKQKHHTMKNLVVTNKQNQKIVLLGPTEVGSKHDKRMLDDSGIAFPTGSRLFQDTGFQGYRPDGIDIHQPTKKPRKGELTDEQKAHNRAISRERIGVEHSIGGIKVSRITREVFRNRRQGFVDTVMFVASGLHNQRMETRMTLAG